MKKGLLSIVLLAMVLLFGCGKSSNVAATVNDVDILNSELDKQMVLTEISYSINGYEFPTGDSLNNLKKEMLNNVAQSYVLVDLAKKRGITIDEDSAKSQSNSLLEGMISIYGSEENYEKFLKEKGQNRKEFDEYIDELAKTNEYIFNLYDDVTKGISVTSDEVKKHYNDNEKYYNYSTASIMNIVTEDQKTAETIYDRITSEKLKFEDAMEEYDGKEGVLGVSDLGAIYYGDQSKDFSEIAFSMKIGEISKPFKSQNYYYVIYVYSKDEQEPMPYNDIKETVETDLLGQKKASAYDQFFKSEEKAYIIKITN